MSLHCEVADILNAYTRLVQQDPSLTGLRAYSAARPPHSEGLGVWIAAYLAHEAECRNVNLLHLSSRKALEAAFRMRAALPHLDLRCEVTVGHLLLDYDTPAGARAKVNPPIRSREDVEFLWQAVLDRKVDWIVSDHACCATETKLGRGSPGRRVARQGRLRRHRVPALRACSARGRGAGCPSPTWRSSCPGTRRGASASAARATSPRATMPTWCSSIPDRSFTVRAADSPSAQGYTPFEGQELRGQVMTTFLRGQVVYDRGAVVGPARGRYLRRPTPAP